MERILRRFLLGRVDWRPPAVAAGWGTAGIGTVVCAAVFGALFGVLFLVNVGNAHMEIRSFEEWGWADLRKALATDIDLEHDFLEQQLEVFEQKTGLTHLSEGRDTFM